MSGNRRLREIAAAALVSVLFVACNGSSDTSRIISNQSQYELKIVLFGGGGRLSDTLVFAPGQARTVSQKTDSAAQEEENDCSERYDSMFARAADTLLINKLIQRNSNWDVETDQTKQIPREFEHSCTFVIRNSDIVL